MRVLYIVLFVSLIANISMAQEVKPLRIAFSRIGAEEKYQLYVDWLTKVAGEFEAVDMISIKPGDAAGELKDCAGLVLTGGADIYPGLYGREKDLQACGKVDRVRDSQEIQLIKAALAMKIPILAICRGAQLMNVYHGGTLIIDIPTDYGSVIAHRLDKKDGAWHDIKFEPKSWLGKLLNTKTGKVNSFHHQAVDKLAPDFMAEAKAKDGIIEAFSWKEPQGKSFLIAVQWHPERMMDDPLFAQKIAELFIEAVRKYHK